MQSLTDYPRNGLRASDVLALLSQSSTVEVSSGLEIYGLNAGDNPCLGQSILLDISDALIPSGSSVEYDNTAKISGTATLVLDPAVWEELTGTSLLQSYAAPGSTDPINRHMFWGNPRTRLRPYMRLTAPGFGTAKFWLGVYVPGDPQVMLDSDQPLYSVTCYDQTSIFDIPITESITFTPGWNVLSAINGLIFDPRFQIPGEAVFEILSDTSRNGASLSSPMSWPVSSGATYLDVINELLAVVGYNPLWADFSGFLSYNAYGDPRTLIDEWVFDTTDPLYSIVSPDGSSWQPDSYNVPNTWLFLQNGLSFAPTEGAGQYSVVNSNTGPASVEKQFGRVLFSRHELDAATQQDLVAQGTAIVVAESMVAETFTINTSPLPIAGHRDVVGFICDRVEPNLIGSGVNPNYRHCYVSSWQLPLDGSDMTWTFGTVG